MKKGFVLSALFAVVAFATPAAAGPVMDAAACALILTGKTLNGVKAEQEKAKLE